MSSNPAYVQAAVAGALADFDREAGPGHTNDPLFALACNLLEIAHGAPSDYSVSQAEQDATSRAEGLGHAPQSIKGTLRSAQRTTATQARTIPARTTGTQTKAPNPAYKNLTAYAQAHGGVGVEVFIAAGWTDCTHQERPALRFTTATAPRYRFLDGKEPKYTHAGGTHKGDKRVWYKLPEALALAAQAGCLTLCNGEASTVVAQHYGIPALAPAGGGEHNLPDHLLDQLRAAWTGPIIVALDGDGKGREAAPKLTAQLQAAGYTAHAVNLGDDNDLADFCKLHQAGALAALRDAPPLATSNMTDADESEDAEDLPPLCPPLPAGVLVSADGPSACAWLDGYIAFSQKQAPEAYSGFHEAVGLWVLSTVAARRVRLRFGPNHYTPLMVALISRTSAFTKSTVAEVGTAIMDAAGLRYMLHGDGTPQALIQSMSGFIGPTYATKSPEEQANVQKRLAFAAQRGWWRDEFGTKLAAMVQEHGTMTEFKRHLRAFDDCEPLYEYSTISRGTDTVREPYLPFLCALTPACLAPLAKHGSALWQDGFLARFALVCPPPDEPLISARWSDTNDVPYSLVGPLVRWHERLGIPSVDVTPRTDDDGNATGFYDVMIGALPVADCTISETVKDAFYAYRNALRALTLDAASQDLDGNYNRFAAKALRISLLLASMGGDERIELRHWARAQQITERWRANLHALHTSLGSETAVSRERTSEDKVLSELVKRGTARSAPEIARYVHLSTAETLKIIDALAKTHQIETEVTARTTKYRATAATNRSNRSSSNRSKQLKVATPICSTALIAPDTAESSTDRRSSFQTPAMVATIATVTGLPLPNAEKNRSNGTATVATVVPAYDEEF